MLEARSKKSGKPPHETGGLVGFEPHRAENPDTNTVGQGASDSEIKTRVLTELVMTVIAGTHQLAIDPQAGSPAEMVIAQLVGVRLVDVGDSWKLDLLLILRRG